MNGETAAQSSVRRSLLRGSAWMVGMRWTMRCIGLVNTFVLARLLLPADFGLVTMATLVIALVEVLGQTGQGLALIRHPDPTRAHYDSVWTLTLGIAFALTLVIWTLAPLAGGYFHEPRAGMLVRVLALRTLIGGFMNVGVLEFRRNLIFSKEFQFQIAQRLMLSAITITLAVLLRNYWALVYSMLLGQCINVVFSYVIHPFRPRFDVSRIAELTSFSAWMLVVHLAELIQNKVDQFVVGGIAGPAQVGEYHIAADAAIAPTAEIVVPMATALFPVFSRSAADPAILRDAYLSVFSVVTILCCSIAAGVAAVAHDFVFVVLGPKWLPAAPLIPWLAISGGCYGIVQSALTLLSATGHGRLIGLYVTTRTLVLVVAVAIAGCLGTVETIAIVRTVVVALFIPGAIMTLARVLPVTAWDMVSRAWRPVIAAGAMAGIVGLVHAMGSPIPLLRLGTDVGAGALAFAIILTLLWWLSGRPSGAEAVFVAVVKERFRRGYRDDDR